MENMTSTTKHQHKNPLTQPSLLWLSELRLNRWCGFMLSLTRTVMSVIHWEQDYKTWQENSWKSGSMTFQVECEPIPNVCKLMCMNQHVNTRLDVWKARQVWVGGWTQVSECCKCWDECQCVTARDCGQECCTQMMVMWHTHHPSGPTQVLRGSMCESTICESACERWWCGMCAAQMKQQHGIVSMTENGQSLDIDGKREWVVDG